jgi:hypothetical protein
MGAADDAVLEARIKNLETSSFDRPGHDSLPVLSLHPWTK